MYQYVILLKKSLWFVGFKNDKILASNDKEKARKFKYKNWAKNQLKFVRNSSEYQKPKVKSIYLKK